MTIHVKVIDPDKTEMKKANKEQLFLIITFPEVWEKTTDVRMGRNGSPLTKRMSQTVRMDFFAANLVEDATGGFTTGPQTFHDLLSEEHSA